MGTKSSSYVHSVPPKHFSPPGQSSSAPLGHHLSGTSHRSEASDQLHPHQLVRDLSPFGIRWGVLSCSSSMASKSTMEE